MSFLQIQFCSFDILRQNLQKISVWTVHLEWSSFQKKIFMENLTKSCATIEFNIYFEFF